MTGTLDSSSWNFVSASLHSALLGQGAASATFLGAASDFFGGAALAFGAGLTRAGASTASSSLANRSTSSDAGEDPDFSSVGLK